MGTYRKEWDCCGSVTETQAWEPEHCPFCETVPAPQLPASTEPARTKLAPMQNEEDEAAGIVREWYFNCDGHYIDVARDDDGKYSVYFRNRNDGEKGKLGREVWFDQADEPMPSTALHECPTCKRTSEIVKLAEHCPFCMPSTASEDDLTPLETVQFWAEAFAKDPERLAGGMIVRLLKEYAQVRAALAKPSTIASSEGYVTLPLEPTEAMIDACARDGVQGDYDNDISNGVKEILRRLAVSGYRAMIAAATPGDAAKDGQ